MTNLAEFYEGQCKRLAKALENTDPLSKEYAIGLDTLYALEYQLKKDASPLPAILDMCEAGKLGLADAIADHTEEGAPEKPEAHEHEPTTEPDTDDDPATEHPHYTKEYVRGRLSAARVDKGVDISEIFKAAGGYANLSAVPVDDYWKLMEALDKALEEKG